MVYIFVMAKTSLGLEENLEGALCYVLVWITGIIFYILEKDNKFVKFHAKQSIFTFLPLWILSIIFGGFFGLSFWYRHGLWYIFTGISWIIWILILILWIILILKAYQGEMFKLPIVGDIAEKGL